MPVMAFLLSINAGFAVRFPHRLKAMRDRHAYMHKIEDEKWVEFTLVIGNSEANPSGVFSCA